MNFKVNDSVVFIDEYGNERIGTIISIEAYGVAGRIGINVAGGYGCYVRLPEEIRHATPGIALVEYGNEVVE